MSNGQVQTNQANSHSNEVNSQLPGTQLQNAFLSLLQPLNSEPKTTQVSLSQRA